MTVLSLGQWQSQNCFLTPCLPWALCRKSKHSGFKGGGLTPPRLLPAPPASPQPVLAGPMVLPGLLAAREDGGTSLGFCMSYPQPPLPGALLRPSLGAVGSQHSLPHRVLGWDLGEGASPWEGSWPCLLPACSRWFLLK